MAFRKLLPLIFLGMCQIGSAQSPTYGVGRSPTADEIRAWDISISPTGQELPSGRGTAREGAQLYIQKGCAGCHGRTGSGSQAPTLIRSDGTTRSSMPCLVPCVNDNNVMALHSPFATVMWDYINRGMPIGKEGTLQPDEVYALTAFLLYKNGVIHEDDVMDAHSVPEVVMPNRYGFAMPTEEWKHGSPRLQGYPKPPQ
ncbi:MAG: cytochrome C [Acidobacteria bacterium]|nr:MAG: cytochrome C [Acidobacteriota bacterium]